MITYILFGLTIVVILSICAIFYMIVSTLKNNSLHRDIVSRLEYGSNIKISPVTAEDWGRMKNIVDNMHEKDKLVAEKLSILSIDLKLIRQILQDFAK